MLYVNKCLIITLIATLFVTTKSWPQQSGYSSSSSFSSSQSCRTVSRTDANGNSIQQQICDDGGGPMAASQQAVLKDGKISGTQIYGQGSNVFQKNLFGQLPNYGQQMGYGQPVGLGFGQQPMGFGQQMWGRRRR